MPLIVFVGLPLVVAGVATYWLGRTTRRVALLAAGGVAFAAAWLVLGWLNSPTSSADADCHHCAEYLGRWMDPIGVLFAGILAATWLAGVATGWAVRAATTRRR